ncbi:MAG: enoyl-CoA hydratase/isomerase family protein [Actinomycetota bacterium]|nr:enoyl-CoA hydratase/isomerase family protein [Actinomycetota bacterium]
MSETGCPHILRDFSKLKSALYRYQYELFISSFRCADFDLSSFASNMVLYSKGSHDCLEMDSTKGAGMFEALEYEVKGEVGVLTLNRPNIVNAINKEMLTELNRFWEERQRDFKTKVIIIRGAGEKGFCSGLDLKAATTEFLSPQKVSGDSVFNTQRDFSRVIRLMRSCPQPIVAAIHGPAMGAGLSLAIASCLRLASEDAFFCAQYINIGTGGADMGSSFFLPRIVGWGMASWLCLTGERIDAHEAHRIGLVNRVVPREELSTCAMEVALNLCLKNSFALRLTKDALNAALNGSSLDDANRMEDRNQALIITSNLLKGIKES